MDSSKQKKSGNIQKLREDVNRSWYEDGMFEISIGVTFLFLIVVLFLYRTQPYRVLYDVIFISTVLASLFGGSLWLPRKLKGQFVWNKVGYSVIKDPYPKSVCVFVGISLLCAAFAMFSIRFLSNEITILSFGFVIFFAFLSQFFQTGRIKRFLFVSLVPLFTSGICALLGLSWKHSIDIMILAIGCVSLLSGVIAYKNFSKGITQ